MIFGKYKPRQFVFPKPFGKVDFLSGVIHCLDFWFPIVYFFHKHLVDREKKIYKKIRFIIEWTC